MKHLNDVRNDHEVRNVKYPQELTFIHILNILAGNKIQTRDKDAVLK